MLEAESSRIIESAGYTGLPSQSFGMQAVSQQIEDLKRTFPPSTGDFAVQLDALEGALSQRLAEEAEKGAGNITDELLQAVQHRLQEIASTGADPHEVELLNGVIKGCPFHQEVEVITRIGGGKVKEVWEKSTDKTHAFSTPKISKGLLGRIRTALRRAELKGEFEIAQKIIQAFRTNNVSAKEEDVKKNLSLDFELTGPAEQVHGRFTLKSGKASGDMEKKFTPSKEPEEPEEPNEPEEPKEPIEPKKPQPFDRSLFSYAGQILQGFSDLHSAGYVHGDPKPENCFFYETEDKGSQVKIADFGKAQRMGPKSTKIYAGNPRYAPPEGSLSQRGEVLSVGMMVVRALESHYLTSDNRMLIKPKESKTGSPGASRVGIERFFVQNKNCPQTDQLSLAGRVSVILKRFGRAVACHAGPKRTEPRVSDTAFHDEAKKYVDALIERMRVSDPQFDGVQLSNLQDLLFQMFDPDPAKRPTMSEANKRYQEISGNLSEAPRQEEIVS